MTFFPKSKNPNRAPLLLTLTILWMIFIFYMSARQGPDSAEDSSFAAMLLLRLFYPGFRSLAAAAQNDLILLISHPVRKCAHATEYAILGALLLQTIKASKPELPAFSSCSAAWLGAVLYAGTDELHQLFVPERSGEIKDVCIDALGALAGVLIMFLAGKYFQRRRDEYK